MGNHRFRLSDMMPNAWFYKLKDMSRARRPLSTLHTTSRPSSSPIAPKPFTPNRASYYCSPRTKTEQFCHSPSHSKASDTHFPISPPRKSHKRPSKPRKPKRFASSVSSNCTCKLATSNIIFDTISDLQLPPIITKPLTREEELPKLSPRRLRVRVSVSTPRLASKKFHFSSARRSFSSAVTTTNQRKRLQRSLAIVKTSSDPQRDFRESMVEMIVENNIRTSKDLEELLACYLTLNSNEYHDVIVKVFEQIWFDLISIIKL